jgi:hypothetical protein
MEPLNDADDPTPPEVIEEEPPTAIPRIIGILNIIFGGLLLLCAVWSGLNLALQSAMVPFMAGQQQQLQKAVEAERKAELQKLEERAKTSKNVQEKAELQKQQKALESQPPPQFPDLSKFMSNSRLRGFTLIDVTTAGLLNILLIVSGIGLIRYQQWGRLTALWVAAIKIVRLVALYSFYAVAVVPGMAQQFRAFFEELARAAPPGPNAPPVEQLGMLATAIAAAMVAYAILMVLFGSIYPIVVLALLTRPRVRDACAAARTASL